jgi:hypothetical protein
MPPVLMAPHPRNRLIHRPCDHPKVPQGAKRAPQASQSGAPGTTGGHRWRRDAIEEPRPDTALRRAAQRTSRPAGSVNMRRHAYAVT